MKSHIIDQIRTSGKTEAEAKEIYDTFTNALKTVIEEKGEARIPQFGNFKKKFRPGRTVRNPANGEPIQTTDKHVITFKQSVPGK